MLDELEYIDPQNRGVNEFLISLMYKNKNDKENAAKYEKLSREHLKQFDEMNKQKFQIKWEHSHNMTIHIL